jgi:hypothetical protein
MTVMSVMVKMANKTDEDEKSSDSMGVNKSLTTSLRDGTAAMVKSGGETDPSLAENQRRTIKLNPESYLGAKFVVTVDTLQFSVYPESNRNHSN